MGSWVATSFGALDMRGSGHTNADVVVLPAEPSEPIGISGDVAALWHRLVDGPVDDDDLVESERSLVREFADFGIASRDLDAPGRVRTLRAPWLSSFMHELVYAMIASVAREEAIEAVFIKGPVLHVQGLRTREHSGDIDVWVDRARVDDLVVALERWGWYRVSQQFAAETYHSVTLRPGAWGCEVDVHFRFPGAASADAFRVITEGAVPFVFGGVEAVAPSVAAHSVINALHLVRPEPGLASSSANLEAARAGLIAAGPAAISAAQELGALDVLRGELEAGFPGVRLPADGGGIPDDWALRARVPNSARYHIAVLRSLPWTARPRALWHILWPADEIVESSAQRAGQTTQVGVRARVSRLMRGAKQLIESRSR